MGLAGMDHAFELGVGQQAVRNKIIRQVRTIGRLRRRNRGHRGRLHQPCWMRLRPWNADGLERVRFIKGIGDAARFPRCPIDHFIRELDARGLKRRDGDNVP